MLSAGTEHHLGWTWPRLRAGGWRLLVAVLPRLELGQSGQAGPGQAAPAGRDHLEQRMASSGQSQCRGERGSNLHRKLNYSLICFHLLLLEILPSLNKQTNNNKVSWIDFLRIFVWFPLDPRSTEHQLLQVNNRSLEEDDEQECERSGDGQYADELLCEEHAAEPHRVLSPAVDEVDDRPDNDLVTLVVTLTSHLSPVKEVDTVLHPR